MKYVTEHDVLVGTISGSFLDTIADSKFTCCDRLMDLNGFYQVPDVGHDIWTSCTDAALVSLQITVVAVMWNIYLWFPEERLYFSLYNSDQIWMN